MLVALTARIAAIGLIVIAAMASFVGLLGDASHHSAAIETIEAAADMAAPGSMGHPIRSAAVLDA